MSTTWTRRAWTLSLIAGVAISLSGCGGAVCTGWSPIRPSKDDNLTDGTARQILKHDQYGASLRCPGFSPKR
jgi:hypothetical protein